MTFEATGAVDHGEALSDLHLGKSAEELHSHTEHGITREWDAAAIDSVVKARGKASQLQKEQAAQKKTPSTTSAAEVEPKPTKGKKGKK